VFWGLPVTCLLQSASNCADACMTSSECGYRNVSSRSAVRRSFWRVYLLSYQSGSRDPADSPSQDLGQKLVAPRNSQIRLNRSLCFSILLLCIRLGSPPRSFATAERPCMKTNTNAYGTRTLMKAEPVAASFLLQAGAVRSMERWLLRNLD